MATTNLIKTSTACANINIALLKYWGKKEEKLNIPYQSSISLTLDGLYTTSTLTLDPLLTEDVLFINGKRVSEKEQIKIRRYLNLVREMYHRFGFIKVDSYNHVPTGAGLASSASSYASIALALNNIYNLKLDQKGLSSLARLGSGSASRSIYGGFSVWHHGEDHTSSFAEQLSSKWDELVFIVVILSREKKLVSSREAMKLSLETPAYQNFIATSNSLYPKMLEAIKKQDLMRLGPLVETSSELLHSTIRASGIDYYLKETYEFLDYVKELKKRFPLFYTLDAGPNVKILTSRQYLDDIMPFFKQYEIVIAGAGGEAYVQTESTR